MKGIVFRKFQDFVEERMGPDLMDDALSLPQLSSGGAYTTVGNYPFSDLEAMVGFLSQETGMPAPDMIRAYGTYLFHQLACHHSEIMRHFSGCLDMLSSIETVIHKEVRKLYTKTELPQLDVVSRTGDTQLILRYESSRPLADLAHGLILGALEHYGRDEGARIARQDLSADGTSALFTISLAHEHIAEDEADGRQAAS